MGNKRWVEEGVPTGGALGPAGGPALTNLAGEEELLYRSGRTRISRHRSGLNRTVVAKHGFGPGASRRLRHEHAVLRRLAGIPGVPSLAAESIIDGAIVMVDRGEVCLGRQVDGTALPTSMLLDLVVQVTRIIAAMHHRGVVHRDINPANLLVDPESLRPTLIDFDLATIAAEERLGFTHTSQISGTLPYLAPEQTGRTGWPVDQRVDLYALGATVYELATGAPPFGRAGHLDLIRSHLTEEPVPPATLNRALPPALSEIILRLLEKEPGQRYQTADGLLYDLTQVRDRLAGGRTEPFPLARRDFPDRLTPARPVGREAETAMLAACLSAVSDDEQGAAVLVTGAAGVGKTTVIDQLRRLVSAHDGWFVRGKFEAHRRDRGADGVWQALRALGRLLLAEPDAELAAARRQLRERLGANAGLLAAVVPEFATLLQVRPESLPEGTAGELERRLARATIDAVSSVTTHRPLVIVIDDLQWAGDPAINVVDRLVTERPAGVVTVGAYRDEEVGPLHPLSAAVSGWQRLSPAPRWLSLENLPVAGVGTLLTEMLHLHPLVGRRLADAVTARTGGNPFDTIELVNALRRDHVLTSTGDSWQWDGSAIRRHIGVGDVIDLLRARIGRLPAPAQELIKILAYLGDRVEVPLLATASGQPAAETLDRFAPALEDGLLVLDSGSAVAFRHDRVRQAARRAAGPELRHTVARRLAARPELSAMAAEQYLAVLAEVTEPAERSRVIEILRTAAATVRLTDPARAEQYLAGASRLAQAAGEAGPARDLLTAVRIEHHAVLCGLARFDEADEVYAAIERLDPAPLVLAAAATARIGSLRSRNRQAEAVDLGLTRLTRLGTTVPSGAALTEATDRGIEALRRWIGSTGTEDDLDRPEVTDPGVLARAGIIEAILPASYFAGQPVFAWLVIEAHRMWAEHGPCAALVPPLSHAGFMTTMLRQDYRTGYEVARRVRAVSEARGYQPQTAHARFLFTLGHGPWFEPITSQLELARQAREDLQRHGDNLVSYSYYSILPLLDCVPTVESFCAEADAALAAAHRTGDQLSVAAYLGYRQLGRALRGETSRPGSLSDTSFDLTAHLAGLAENRTATAIVRTCAAVAAAIFHDGPALAEHSAAAMPLLRFINATYLTATAHLVRALSLADQLHTARPEESAALRDEFQACRDWLARRAADAPMNFDHLILLLDAESQRWDGDGWAAARGFDAAIAAAARRSRPWHQAMISERAGRYYCAQGMEQIGQALLGQARRGYLGWGALAKVAQLDQAYPALAERDEARESLPGTTSITLRGATIDILAVLSASRALSSATNLDVLRERVADVVGAMTGATGIRLLLWKNESRDWLLPSTEASDDQPLLARDREAAAHVPVSVVRYVQRTGEPLLIEDAVSDDRFARDPYLTGLDACSMMAVPIQSRGAPQALLLLDKRHTQGAFTAAGLDTVILVAGQLAVSIENAMVYASLERKVNERTQALSAANERLQELTRTDPLTGLANRRRFEDALAGEWDRALGTRTPIAILMIDIDYFKWYNDRHGHLAGDRCLQRVARALADSVRAPDLVVRYGGEEFAMILPGAGVDAAHQVAERVRLAVAGIHEEHRFSPTGIVTVSVGVASAVPAAGTGPQALVEDADRSLYEAKRDGRNRIAVAGG